MDYLPAFLDVKRRRCLVVGGGATAERKVAMLLLRIPPRKQYMNMGWFLANLLASLTKVASFGPTSSKPSKTAWSRPFCL